MKYIIVLLSLACTWAGFEAYHVMREQDFLSVGAIVMAFVSLGLVLSGSLLGRIAVGSN